MILLDDSTLVQGPAKMPLLDHFHPPLSIRRHWHAFHNSWATYISSQLNQQLPEGFFSEVNVQFGIEIDVGTFEQANGKPSGLANGWKPPEPNSSVTFVMLTDLVEIQVFSSDAGPTLVGAIELVSPANKDRPNHRDAFVSKCAGYLQQGVGLIILDAVTQRKGNLHNELLQRVADGSQGPMTKDLYAVSYRPVERDGQTKLDMWCESLTIAKPLPELPLWLKGGLCLQVNFNESYERTCREQRVLGDDKNEEIERG